MKDTTMDIKSTLKRAGGIIKYFGRVVHTDKITYCLLALVFIGILVCIIMGSLGLDEGKFNIPD